MVINPERTLYILCGGKSRRMGTDKALLRLEGSTFLNRLISRSRPFFREVVLLCAGNRYPDPLRHIADARLDIGPLGGLLAALHDCDDQPHIAVLPVDSPRISGQTLSYLAQAMPGPDLDALIARSGTEVQPLMGIYKVRVSKRLGPYLDGGGRRVMGFLDTVDYAFFDVGWKDISNINTPDDYKRL